MLLSAAFEATEELFSMIGSDGLYLLRLCWSRTCLVLFYHWY